jgi:SAM-dependent methyltransferase
MTDASAPFDYEALWSSPTWGEMQDFGPVHRHSARLIVQTVRPLRVSSVVDVGCGTGLNLREVQRQLAIKDVVGVDVSATALEIARRQVQGELILRDMIAEPPLERVFDLVLSSQVIEHIEDDDAFLGKLHAMCGRYCLVATVQGRMRPSEAKIGHLRNYTRRGLEAKLRRAGFEIEKVIEWGFPFYSPLYRTAIELVGGQDVKVGGRRRLDRVIGEVLYQLYRLNSSRRGDVLMVLARRKDGAS